MKELIDKTLTYKVFLHKEPEGTYTVSFPALPGCITYGDNVDHAISMAKETNQRKSHMAAEKLLSSPLIRLKQTNSSFHSSNSVCFLTPHSLRLFSAIFRRPFFQRKSVLRGPDNYKSISSIFRIRRGYLSLLVIGFKWHNTASSMLGCNRSPNSDLRYRNTLSGAFLISRTASVRLSRI